MSYQIIPASKILEAFTKSLSGLRTGRVNSSILDTILVSAYGSKMHVHEVSTINIPEPSQLMITPFDKSLLPAIEKAITDSNIGVNPVNDGAGIRLVFQPLTEETRKTRVKEIYKLLEESKIAVRSTRQDLLKTQKKLKDDSQISEDELKKFETDLQKEVDSLNKDLENIAKDKEAEMMKV